MENMNTSLSLDAVEIIIKSNHIINNIVIVSRPQVIKVLPRLDMSIIWLDNWDIQSSSKAKGLINRYFNVRSYIAIIWGANMNLESSSARIAGNEITPLSYVESRNLDAWSIIVLSKDIISTKNSTLRNIKNFMITENNQFV